MRKNNKDMIAAAFAEFEATADENIEQGLESNESEDLEGTPGADLEPEEGPEEPAGDEFEAEGDDEGLDFGGAPGADLESEEGEDDSDLETEVDDGDENEAISFAQAESELDALAEEQGLNDIPEGVTASAEDIVEYLLATGAVVELSPISREERSARHSAFASIEESEFFATADEEDLEGLEAPEDESDEGSEPGYEGEDAGEDEDLELEGADELDFGNEDDEPADETEDEAPVEGEACASTVMPTKSKKSAISSIKAALADSKLSAKTKARLEGALKFIEGLSNPIPATASSVTVHPVADREMVALAASQDVQMVLTNGQDPRWNVIIAGVPAAVISLSSLENGEAVRASFCSEAYRHNVIATMDKVGVAQVLADLGAEMYGNQYQTSEVAQEIRASVTGELAGGYTAKLVEMRDEFLDRASLATAGMAKGYFAHLPNPLYVKACEVLAARGVLDVEVAAAEIAQASADMFAVASAKAVELMDRSPEFVEQLRENIGEAATMARASVQAPAAVTAATSIGARSLASRLANPEIGIATASVQAPSSSDFRSSLAAKVGRLGARR